MTRGIMYQAELARQFAENAHAGQVRKYTGQAYIEHPTRVATALIDTLMFSDDQECINAVQAAFLHDVVEDTEATFEDILDIFGEVTTSYVWFLTKPPAFVENRAVRKLLDRWRLAHALPIVKFIKILDVMDNAVDIEKYDPEFWQTFKYETRLLFDAINADNLIDLFEFHFFEPEEFRKKYRLFVEKIAV